MTAGPAVPCGSSLYGRSWATGRNWPYGQGNCSGHCGSCPAAAMRTCVLGVCFQPIGADPKGLIALPPSQTRACRSEKASGTDLPGSSPGCGLFWSCLRNGRCRRSPTIETVHRFLPMRPQGAPQRLFGFDVFCISRNPRTYKLSPIPMAS